MPLHALVVALPLIVGSCQLDDNVAKGGLGEIQGTWDMVSNVRAGKAVPDPEAFDTQIVNRDDKYVIRSPRGGIIFTQGTHKVDPAKNPKAIDVTPSNAADAGKTFLGIYEIDGDMIKVCLAPFGKERPTRFESTRENGNRLQVWKRLPPQHPGRQVAPGSDSRR